MSHEHHGDCCGHQPDQLTSTLITPVSQRLGALCCSGHCQHPEHQAMLHVNLPDWLDEEDDDGTDKDRKKKRQRQLINYDVRLAGNLAIGMPLGGLH